MPTAEQLVHKQESRRTILTGSEVADVTQNTIENTIRQKNAAILGWLRLIERDLSKTSVSELNVANLVSKIQIVIGIAQTESLLLLETEQALCAYAKNPEKPVILDLRYEKRPIWPLCSNPLPTSEEPGTG